MNLVKEGKSHTMYGLPKGPEVYHDLVVLVANDKFRSPDYTIENFSVENKGKLQTQISKKWAKIIDGVPSLDTDPISGERYGWADQLHNEMQLRNRSFKGSVFTAVLDPNGGFDAFMSKEKSHRLKEELKKPQFVDRSQVQLKLDMLPIEFIVRGYVAGSLWRAHTQGERIFCGNKLPENLHEGDKLDRPIFTPRVKVKHEPKRNVPYRDMVSVIDEYVKSIGRGDLDASEIASSTRAAALYYYERAAEFSELHGNLILADTRFEFGLDPDSGKDLNFIMLGGEILTPECSRFWLKEQYSNHMYQSIGSSKLITERLFKITVN